LLINGTHRDFFFSYDWNFLYQLILDWRYLQKRLPVYSGDRNSIVLLLNFFFSYLFCYFHLNLLYYNGLRQTILWTLRDGRDFYDSLTMLASPSMKGPEGKFPFL